MDKRKNNYARTKFGTNYVGKKILLDTNFLLVPYQFRVDIFTQIDKIMHSQYKIFVLDKSVEELKKVIKEQKGKSKDAAKIALKLVAIKNIAIVETQGNERTDDVIIDLSSKNNYIVATQDKDLKRRLINLGIEVIVLRQKKILAIANDKGF